MTGKRLLVRSNNAAASSGNCLRRFRCCSCRLLQSALGRAEALRSGFGFARTSAGWCALHHGKDSILVRDRLSLSPIIVTWLALGMPAYVVDLPIVVLVEVLNHLQQVIGISLP